MLLLRYGWLWLLLMHTLCILVFAILNYVSIESTFTEALYSSASAHWMLGFGDLEPVSTFSKVTIVLHLYAAWFLNQAILFKMFTSTLTGKTNQDIF